jgi:DNA-binding transcriptional LysR family regulator
MHTGALRIDARSNAASCSDGPRHEAPAYGLELRQLRYLVILSEERNMTRAAVRLHLTQPALSQALSNLELRLGVRMFERVPRGVELTGTGAAFIGYARTAVAAADAAEAAAARLVAQRRNQIVIAFTTGLMAVASRLVCSLRCEDRSLEISMKHTSTKTLVQGLTAGSVDLGLACPELRVRGVKTVPALPSSLVALISSEHPLAAQATVTAEQLLCTDLVGPWAQELIQRAATISEIAESEASDEDELASIEEAWPDILAGKAIAVVPSFVAASFTTAGVVALELADDHAHTAVGISRRADDPRPLTRAAHELLEGVAAA